MIEAILTFIKAFWRPILGALVLLAAWWWHSGQVKAALAEARDDGRAEVQALWDKAVQDQKDADATANQANRKTEGENNARVINAQGQRAQSAGDDAALLAGVRTERDGLRRSLSTALNTIRHGCDVPGATADAQAGGAAAVQKVFGELAGEAEELARAADAHAADSLMYQQAWPQR
ncbi:hypothetical protein FVQ98_13975 [Ottowia sp. GY511]|uniref:DUF2514 family protein n=1 Tax=Ottowia flava TaxID=2675430 RepID=A0ABW4KPC0_9BURK|nr:hypothetical protein [Ottowia sp. GY511]TXK26481.1 hypothetical protein FVQ98_13975 [Ottowia sp. GY511]